MSIQPLTLFIERTALCLIFGPLKVLKLGNLLFMLIEAEIENPINQLKGEKRDEIGKGGNWEG